jgi:hypothetical protein
MGSHGSLPTDSRPNSALRPNSPAQNGAVNGAGTASSPLLGGTSEEEPGAASARQRLVFHETATRTARSGPCREAFGVRGACSRFRISSHADSASKLDALHTLRELWRRQPVPRLSAPLHDGRGNKKTRRRASVTKSRYEIPFLRTRPEIFNFQFSICSLQFPLRFRTNRGRQRI